MALPQIKIGDDLLGTAMLSSVEVVQELNHHWWCTVVCRNTEDQRVPVEQLLGKPMQIKTTDDQGSEHIHFTGFIYNVELGYEVYGNYSATLQAVTSTYRMDCAARKEYYLNQTLATVASSMTGRDGVAITVDAPASKALNYTQYGETDWSFLNRMVDDYGAWMRPGPQGLEVHATFQAGSAVAWRAVDGLIDFQLEGTMVPATFGGSHYDHHAMASQTFKEVAQAPSYYDSASALTAAVMAQSKTMPEGFEPQRARAMTLGDYGSQLSAESERSVGAAVMGTGSSRNQVLLAGNTLDIQGALDAKGTYGLVKVVHTWDLKGYSNTFKCTPWKNYRNPEPPVLRSWNGVVSARVVGHNDPKKMGRLQVRFFWQTEGETHWARATSPHAGPDRGFMFMPEVGDEVAVAFEDGDPERPVILGSLWNGVQQAPRDEFRGGDIVDNNVKRILTKAGNRMVISDLPGKETFLFGTPHSTRMVLTEKADETGRTMLLLESAGDIILSAPQGRVHIQSQFFSREVGVPPPPQAVAAPNPAAPAVTKPALAASPVPASVASAGKQARLAALKKAQDRQMHDPNNQPSDGGRITHCNSATYHIVKQTGAPTSAFMKADGSDVAKANVVAGNLASSPDWTQVSPQDAQAYANDGGTAVGAYQNPVPGHDGHLVTLRPEESGDAASDSPVWNNIGTHNLVEPAAGTVANGMKYYVPSGAASGH